MNKEEQKQIAEKISPRLRKRIERFSKLTVEERYVLHQRSQYFNGVLAVIVIFCIFQLPLKVLYTSLSTLGFRPEFAALMFVASLFKQAVLLVIIAIIGIISFIYIKINGTK